MKKITTLLFAICIGIAAFATNIVVTTGEDEASGHFQTPIVHGNYFNYVTQQIYTASELGGASNTGTITSIFFHYKSSGAWCSTNRTNFKVYLNTTSSSNFSNGQFVDKGTEVYSSTSFNTPESATWYELELTTPFAWDGTSNVVVTIIDNSNARVSISTNKYHYVYSGTARAIFKTGLADDQINANITGVAGTAINKIANAKFAITLAEIIVPAPTSPTSTVGRHSATIGWTAAEGANSYEVRYGTTSQSLGDPVNVGNVTSYEISGLEENTTYYYQIRTKIGEAYSAWTSEASFKTEAHTHDGITFDNKWTYSGTLPFGAGNYYLAHDVTLSADWQPGGNINLCLNGHTVNMGEYYGKIDNVLVTLFDDDATGSVTSSNSSQTFLATGSSAIFTNKNAIIANTGGGRLVSVSNNARAQIYAPITMSDALDNSPSIGNYSDITVNIEMTRSLTSSQYNTICLPFDLHDNGLKYYFGEGYELWELTGSDLSGGELTLTFTSRYSLVAGKPYLLQPAHDVVNPSFEGVTIAATSAGTTETSYIDFKGIYSPTELESNKNLLFLGAGNELFWPESTGNMNGFRAYFEVKGSDAQAAKHARIIYSQDAATALDQTESARHKAEKFIRNGQLIIERNGFEYNAQGQLMK